MFIYTILGKPKLGNLLYQKHLQTETAKMLKYDTIEIWSKIPLETKNKLCLTLFTAE